MNSDCLSELVSQVSRPEVGVVGARLWYPNGTLQHGGVILGAGGVASHIDSIRRDDPGYFARQHLTQDFCAVTAACLMVRREVFEKLGGFDESRLPVTFNDVDFCLRARELGWRIIYTPYAELTHHESVSRGMENTTEKQRRFFKRERVLAQTLGPTDPKRSGLQSKSLPRRKTLRTRLSTTGYSAMEKTCPRQPSP